MRRRAPENERLESHADPRRLGDGTNCAGHRFFGDRKERMERSMSGTTDKIKGTIKEGVGKATGNKKTEAEGQLDQAKGNLKNAAHDAKEKVKDAAK
jgi:uncharacterized protein YjbJ (UPF0337 family)